MATTVVRMDLREFDAQLAKLRRPQTPVNRALKRTIDSAKTFAARLVSQDMGLKVTAVKRELATRVADGQAVLKASARRVPLINFNARGPEPSRGRGAGVRVKNPGGTERFPHAFIATVGTGQHRGVFQRQGMARLPIRELRGASIWQSYQRVAHQVETYALEHAGQNLAHEIAFALSKQ